MKRLSTIFLLAGALVAFSTHAQSVTSYLNDTADAAWRIEIVTPEEAKDSADSFWAKLRSLLGIRQTTRIKPPVGTKLVVQASAYASSPYQTDSTPCITAAGTKVRPGVVATNFLPLGAILEINGDKYIVEDRMNSRYNGYYMDIWFPSTSTALEFGRKKLDIVIVGYGEPGDEVRQPEEPVKKNKTAEEDAGFWSKLKDQAISVTGFLSARISGDVNRHDVNCVTEEGT